MFSCGEGVSEQSKRSSPRRQYFGSPLRTRFVARQGDDTDRKRHCAGLGAETFRAEPTGCLMGVSADREEPGKWMNPASFVENRVLVGVVACACLQEGLHQSTLTALASSWNHDGLSFPSNYSGMHKQSLTGGLSKVEIHV